MDPVKIVLIRPPSHCVEDDRREPPLGLLYLAASAREAGFEDISLVDMSGCRDDAQVDQRILETPRADVYGVSAFCTNTPSALRVAARAKELNPSALVVMGGPNPSALPYEMLRDEHVDAVVIGEGEDAFVRCVEGAVTGRPNTGLITGIARNDIDSYAFPARDLVDESTYTRRLMGKPQICILSSRGCPHRCAYCNSSVMGGGSRIARYRSADNVCAELEEILPRCRSFRFNDDNFAANPRLDALLRRISELDVTFRIFARIEDLTPVNCKALRDAGCVHVSIGLESLNQDNLRAMRKISQLGNLQNVRAAREAGLCVRAYFMVGLPYDNDANIDRSFGQAAKLGLGEATVYPLIPYPGTDIANHPEQYGYRIVDSDYTHYVQLGLQGDSAYVLATDTFGPDDVRRWKTHAESILLSAGIASGSKSEIAV